MSTIRWICGSGRRSRPLFSILEPRPGRRRRSRNRSTWPAASCRRGAAREAIIALRLGVERQHGSGLRTDDRHRAESGLCSRGDRAPQTAIGIGPGGQPAGSGFHRRRGVHVALYGTHPYAHPAGGTMDSNGRIGREDIVRFHETYFAPNTSALAIAGDLTPEEAFALAEEWFGAWERKDVPTPDVSKLDEFEGPKIVVIDNPDSVRPKSGSGRSPSRGRIPDYFPVLIAFLCFGRSFGPAHGIAARRARSDLRRVRNHHPAQGPRSLYALTETRPK